MTATTLSCAYCLDELANEKSLYCRSCGTPTHEDCWHENRGCAVLGCEEAPRETSPPGPGLPAYEAMPPPAGPLLVAGSASAWPAEASSPHPAIAAASHSTSFLPVASPSAAARFAIATTTQMATGHRRRVAGWASGVPAGRARKVLLGVGGIALLVGAAAAGSFATRANVLPGGHVYGDKELRARTSAAHDAGYSAGSEDGRAAGYDSGHSAGYDEGKAAGYEDGHSAGYDEGYSAGEAAAASESTDAYQNGYSAGYSSGVSCAAGSYDAYLSCTGGN